jgi:glycosyltransferase involved in cell wall biosynthesis
MLIIDASNINSGGGETLLNYLVESLDRAGINYFVLTDHRWLNNTIAPSKKKVVKINVFNRKKILKQIFAEKKPETVLFFGNFPPPFKLDPSIKTITYFQNNLLVNWKNTEDQNFLRRIYLIITRIYLSFYLANSEIYCFQNRLTKNDFILSYGLSKNVKYIILPFFKIETKFDTVISEQKKDAFIYVSTDRKHKNHINLFHAWEILFDKGFNYPLYVTLDESKNTDTIYLFKKLVRKNVPIINLGIISQSEVFEKCKYVKYSIFPSLVETIGLNLVESCVLGCKVLAPDLNYIDEVIVPSLRFNPNDPMDIANKVKFALSHEIPDSSIIIKNEVDELISLLGRGRSD